MLEVHEIADTIPEMLPTTYQALRRELTAFGLIHPILMFQGRILNGRFRYKGCLELGIEPRFIEFPGDYQDAINYMLHEVMQDLTAKRLSESQKRMVAAKLTNLSSGQRVDLAAPPHGGAAEPISTAQAAAKLGVSVRSTERTKEILATGVPELVKAVENGELSTNTAATVAKLPPDRQRDALAEGPSAIKRAVRTERAKKTEPRYMSRPLTSTQVINRFTRMVDDFEPVAQKAGGEWALNASPAEREQLRGVLQRLLTALTWLDTILKTAGTVTDEALANLIKEEWKKPVEERDVPRTDEAT